MNNYYTCGKRLFNFAENFLLNFWVDIITVISEKVVSGWSGMNRVLQKKSTKIHNLEINKRR